MGRRDDRVGCKQAQPGGGVLRRWVTGINGDQADNTARSAGAVYVFVRQGSTWTQQA
jgi:hypothetical protein